MIALSLLLVLTLPQGPGAAEGGAVTALEEEVPLLATAGSSPTEVLNAGARSPGKAKDVMTELLHWSIEHSDPERLKVLMQMYKEGNLTLASVYGKDVLDALFADEASIMTESIAKIAQFRNASVKEDELADALATLQELVDQVDNAGNLHRMGGLEPLLDLALDSNREAATRALAIWTLGVAVQNNPPVQADLMGLDGLTRLAVHLNLCGGSLLGHSNHTGSQEGEGAHFCGKLLYALSGLVKNNESIQASSAHLGVCDWLLDVGAEHEAVAIAKKSLGLLETIMSQNPAISFMRDVNVRQETIAAMLLGHIRGSSGAEEADTDLAEKALRFLNKLLALRPTLFAPDFREHLMSAVREAEARCERAFGIGDELCAGLVGLASHAELILLARDVPDQEL